MCCKGASSTQSQPSTDVLFGAYCCFSRMVYNIRKGVLDAQEPTLGVPAWESLSDMQRDDYATLAQQISQGLKTLDDVEDKVFAAITQVLVDGHRSFTSAS